ncbi:hypothetical protein LTR17_004276 [Elasticomyces elasticus]|nr:hypothetical protein LTR17_004276 [Elasticomyces elasticus]
MPRIAIAGLGCETSTFSPARTHASAFHPRRGDEILQTYKFLQHGTDLGNAATWHGSLIGHALPGGIVTKNAFEELAHEIVRRLKDLVQEEPLDGLWYDIHGAMVVEELDDCEAELLRRIRQVIGPDAIVSASMDLHGNVSRELVHQTDLITCYRTAPHVDVMETKQRACHNLVAVLNSKDRLGKRPLKAWIPVPILLAGEQTSTRIEPAKRLYAAVPEVEALDDVLDASIWVGYAWADEPRNCAAVAVTGWDEQAVKRGAERLADIFWEAHEEFDFVAPTGSLDECLKAALGSQKRPYFISDSGDNPTAGGAGDVTCTLHRLLDRTEFKSASGPKVVYASIPAGSQAMQTVVEAGVGATVTVMVGAEVDNIHAGPVQLTGRVHSIKHGDRHARIEAVIHTGTIFVIVTELRKPYHHEQDFTDLDLDVRKGAADIVLVKIGYLEPELFNMAADWMMALTPGGVNQDLERLGHKRIVRPMWPFDKVFNKKPDLSARLVPGSNEQLL